MQTNTTKRPVSEGMEALLGERFDVLDHGYIIAVDYMGNDSEIVEAARTSYGDGTRAKRDGTGLIRHLMREWHTSPFEMVEVKIQIQAPMDLWRQWIRHRTASVNEYSTRYSVALDMAAATAPGAWRMQGVKNRQGSEGFIDLEKGAKLTEAEKVAHEVTRYVYDERIKAGVAREQARKDLPLSTYTRAVWKIDGHNLLHFLLLRCDPAAQHEIRLYADTLAGIVKAWLPVTWAAFEDYRLGAMTLSATEIRAIRSYFQTGSVALDDFDLSKSEREDLSAKLEKLIGRLG